MKKLFVINDKNFNQTVYKVGYDKETVFVSYVVKKYWFRMTSYSCPEAFINHMKQYEVGIEEVTEFEGHRFAFC